MPNPTIALTDKGVYQNIESPDINVLNEPSITDAIHMALSQFAWGFENAMDSSICDEQGKLIDLQYLRNRKAERAAQHKKKYPKTKKPQSISEAYAAFADDAARRTAEKIAAAKNRPPAKQIPAEPARKPRPAAAASRTHPNKRPSPTDAKVIDLTSPAQKRNSADPRLTLRRASLLARPVQPTRFTRGRSATSIMNRLAQPPAQNAQPPRRLATQPSSSNSGTRPLLSKVRSAPQPTSSQQQVLKRRRMLTQTRISSTASARPGPASKRRRVEPSATRTRTPIIEIDPPDPIENSPTVHNSRFASNTRTTPAQSRSVNHRPTQNRSVIHRPILSPTVNKRRTRSPAMNNQLLSNSRPGI